MICHVGAASGGFGRVGFVNCNAHYAISSHHVLYLIGQTWYNMS